MNASMSMKAYATPAVRGGRDSEYDAFSLVTRLLVQAPRVCGNPETVRAISKNNELWMLLTADLAHPANGLDDSLRAGLLSLAQFALKHGQQVLAGGATTEVLIDINLAVMKGLRGNG